MAASPSQIQRSKVKSLTVKHDPIDNEPEWIRHVYKQLNITAASRITYMRKYQFQNTLIYMVQEYGERISSSYAASLCKIKVTESELSKADFGFIFLEQALIDLGDSSKAGKLLVSDSVIGGDIIVQYNNERTVKASFKEFVTKVGEIIEVEQVCLDECIVNDLQNSRNSPESHVRDVVLNADNLNRLQRNSSEASSVALAKAIKALSTAELARVKVDETTKKLGRLNEETIRHRLNGEEGIPWASSFRFETLWEIVDWVGMKIKADKNERFKAMRDIVRLCVAGFEGYVEADDNIDWEKVFDPINE
jgi:hypothetical protein